MTYRDLAAVELRDKVGAHVGETLEHGGTVFEWRHRRKDGSELPVEIRTAPFVAQGKQRIWPPSATSLCPRRPKRHSCKARSVSGASLL